MASQNKVEVLAELDLAGDYAPGRVISITGTNGKSTISAWVHWMLREAGVDSRLGGNFGIPTVETLAGATTASWCVWEVSSYQLENTHRFHPSIAVLCNITPDHLHRHGTVGAYGEAKMRQFFRQGTGDVAILNLDDSGVQAAVVQHPLHPEINLQGYALGLDSGAAGLTDGELWLLEDGQKQPIAVLADLPVPGPHNASNALAAALAVRAAGLSIDQIRQHLVTFQGLPHRLERLPSVDGLVWINDSKSTNLESTLAALSSFSEPFHLVLGGAEKQLDYTALYQRLEELPVRSLVGMGPAGARMINEMRDSGVACPTHTVKTVADAVQLMRQAASTGELVLFSPGAPSFNEFRNFEMRGDSLRTLVQEPVQAIASA